MSEFQNTSQHEKDVKIMVECSKLNKNYVVECPFNAPIQEVVQILSEVIEKPSELIFLRLDKKTLDPNKTLSDYCTLEETIVLSLEIIQKGGQGIK